MSVYRMMLMQIHAMNLYRPAVYHELGVLYLYAAEADSCRC